MPTFSQLLASLNRYIQSLPDKPEETPEATLRALWFLAAGERKSAQAAMEGDLPELDSHQTKKLDEYIDLRCNGTPLAHITQRQRFMDVELIAGPNALVPRKETEILASSASDLLRTIIHTNKAPLIIDVCTGSGNLAITYARIAPGASVFAADLSADAVELAKQNVSLYHLEKQVELRVGDLLAPFDTEEFHGKVSLLSCNPPYISSAKVSKMHHEIADHEPRLAFDGGPFGIKVITRLIAEAPKFLHDGGWLAFEIGFGQGLPVMQRMEKSGAYREIRTVADPSGEIRAILARK